MPAKRRGGGWSGTSSGRTGGERRALDLGQAARVANILIGAWLFVSAFAWPHDAALRTETWIAGLLMALIAAVALFAEPMLRYLNTFLSFWLFVTSLSSLQSRRGTLWNNLIASALVFLLSLVSSRTVGRSKGFAKV
jgi:hypothetical protein